MPDEELREDTSQSDFLCQEIFDILNVDRTEWFALEQAYQKIMKGQRRLLTELGPLLNVAGASLQDAFSSVTWVIHFSFRVADDQLSGQPLPARESDQLGTNYRLQAATT